MKKIIETKQLILPSIIILMPVIFGFIVWNKLPEQMARHFDFYGNADGYSSKVLVVAGLPLLLFFVMISMSVLTNKYNRQQDEKTVKKLTAVMIWFVALISFTASIFTLLFNLNIASENHINIFSVVIVEMISFVFIVSGNYMPKIRQNKFVGIRIPAAFKSEAEWTKINRLGGKIFVVTGILTAIAGFINPVISLALFIVSALAVLIIPVFKIGIKEK